MKILLKILVTIILLFVIVNARSTSRQQAILKGLKADNGHLAAQVSSARERLAILRNALAEAARSGIGRSRRVVSPEPRPDTRHLEQVGGAAV